MQETGPNILNSLNKLLRIILIIVFFTIVFFIITYLYKGKDNILYLPIYLYPISIIKIFLSPSQEDTGAAVYLSFTFIFFTLFIVYQIIKDSPIKNRLLNLSVITFVIYIFILIPNSTDQWWSFKRILTAAVWVLTLLGGFYYFNTFKDLKRFSISIIGLIIIFELNILYSSVFKLGSNYYVGSTIYFGSIILWSSWGFVFSLLLYPLLNILRTKNSKIFLTILAVAGFIILFLVTKRAYLLTIFLGFFIYIIAVRKMSILKYLVPSLILLYLTSSFWLPQVDTRFEQRQLFERKYENEGRFIEFIAYPTELGFKNNQIEFLLFGSEPFNSQGKYLFFELLLKDKNRIFHSDYAALLYGTGLIGLTLYIFIFYSVLRNYLLYAKNLSNTKYNMILKGTFLSIFVTIFSIGFMDSLLYTETGMIAFLFLGGLLGIIKHQSLIDRGILNEHERQINKDKKNHLPYQ